METMLLWLGIGGALYWLAKQVDKAAKQREAVKAALNRSLDPLICLYAGRMPFIVQTIGGGQQKARGYFIAVTREQIAFYNPQRPDPLYTLAVADLRWFGRPHKYRAARRNELRLHAEIEGRWVVIRLWLNLEPMRKVVRALKEVATEDHVIAYRRRRPYLHTGPVSVQPAQQDIHGSWTLEAPRQLYLTPGFLVLLDGTQVQQVFPLDQVQRIAAVQRLDQPNSAGLLRFEGGGSPYAFALPGYATFAAQLAEAAKRTLEDPVQWQRKKKKIEADEPIDELID